MVFWKKVNWRNKEIMIIKEMIYRFLNKSKTGEDLWYWFHIINVNMRRVVPDKMLIKKSYMKMHGSSIRFDNPITFDEKQLWLKLNYRNPLCVICSDKYLVRKYVEDNGYGHILNRLYAVYNSVNEIEWDNLPQQFYMKVNHMSGCNIRCNDKTKFNRKEAIKRIKRGMRHDYSLDSREWNYKNIRRKILIEAIIENHDKSPLVDYRFLCYNGRCEYIFVDIGTADENGKHLADAHRNVYDRDMNLLDVQVSRKRFPSKLVVKPINFEEMRKCAERLSGHFPFCRVDLYNVDGKILFGEITFFHAGGLSSITPKEWEIKLGDPISIDLAKKQMANCYVTY